MMEAAAAIAVTVALVLNMTVETGTASQYSPGVMGKVVDNRQRMGQLPIPLPDVDGCIAVLD